MYQFIHVESYSRTAPKSAASGGKAGRSIGYIVNEATRDEGSIPHIEQPAPPVYLHGKPLEQLESTCEAWASTMTDAKGRKLRKDALCLAAGVVSAPHDIEPEAWKAFKTDAVEWLKTKYGDRLQTVIEHVDESHPHLHFYAVPLPGERFESVHQGKAAAAEAKADGALKGVQNQRYKAAMRVFQDEFFDSVGIRHGMTRIGPGKRRLTREEWKLEQIQAAAAKAALDRAETMTADAKTESKSLIASAKAEAKTVAAAALEKADDIEREAEKKGFAKGIADTEKMPWWKRVKLFIGSVAKERDELKNQVQGLTQELAQERGEKQSLTEKAKKWFSAGKAAVERVKQLEPALKDAQREARQGRAAIKENESLRDDLSAADGRAKHWEAVAQAHMPEPEVQPTMTVPGDKKRKLEDDSEYKI